MKKSLGIIWMSLYQLHHAESFCCPVIKKNVIHARGTAAIFFRYRYFVASNLPLASEAQFKLLQAVGQMREVDLSSYIEIESDKSF